MIIVHHLNNSRSQRVLWLLEELGLEYQIKPYQRDRKTMLAPAELRQVHPLGKSPVITDGGVTLAESGAIIAYLAERYGAGRTAQPPLLMKLLFDRIKTAPMPFFVRPIARKIADTALSGYVLPNLERNLD